MKTKLIAYAALTGAMAAASALGLLMPWHRDSHRRRKKRWRKDRRPGTARLHPGFRGNENADGASEKG